MTASKIVMNAASGVGGGTPYSIENATFTGETGRVFIRYEPDGTSITGQRQIFFGDNGTKLYMCAVGQYKLHRWDLSTAYDLNTAEYNGGHVFGTDGITGVFFNNDGTKLYLGNQTSDEIKEYDLSTAWDITTGTLSHTLDVSSRTTGPQGIFFKPDGTEMYVVDNPTDSVEQFTLSTGWDLSTATWTRARSVAEEASPHGIAFKSDGTKMYILGTGDDAVNEYTLSTAWDISTETHTRVGTALNGNCYGFALNDDGTKFYIVHTSRYAILQYDLSTAYNVSTMSLSTIKSENFLDVIEVLRDAGQDVEANARGMTFSSDGTKLYFSGTARDSLIELSLSTPYDLSTASYSETLSINSYSANPYGHAINDSGTEFIIGDQSTVDQYTFSTGYDLSTQTNFNTKDVSSGNFSLMGPQFFDNGTKGYFVCYNRKTPVLLSLSTGWDITTASLPTPNGLFTSSEDANVQGVAFNSDGTKLFLSGYSNDKIYRYSLSTAYDVSTATLDWSSVSFGTTDGVVRGIWVNSSANQIWMMGTQNDRFLKATLTSSGITGLASYSSPAPDDAGPVGIFYKSDGKELYYGGSVNDKIYQWTLSTAFNPNTKTGSTKELDVSNEFTNPRGVFLNSAGTILLVSGSTSDGYQQVAKYTLSTAWDISTATYSQIAKIYCAGYDLWAKADGTKIFTTDNTMDEVFQFDLSTAWDLSTISHPATSTIAYLGDDLREINGGQTPNGFACRVSEDADLLLYSDATTDNIFEFSMGTAHDLSTLSYTENKLSVRPNQGSVSGLAYNSDGTKLFTLCYEMDTIMAYKLA